MYRLRELQREDLPVINAWRNKSELIAFLGAPFRYINLEVDVAWFDNYMRNRQNMIRCAIIRVEDDALLGLVSLTNIDFLNQSAEFHIMIGDSQNQGQGAGTFAVRAMIEHAFFNMNLHRVTLGVLEDNLRAQHVYEKVGFVREGIERASVFKEGRFVSIYRYAILREECELPPQKKKTNVLDEYTYCIDEIGLGTYRMYLVKQLKNVFPHDIPAMDYAEFQWKINMRTNFIVAYHYEILGFVAFYANDRMTRTAYITLIAIAYKAQRHHVGSSLLQRAEEIARLQGMKTMKLEVWKDNFPAQRFYHLHQYEETGEETPTSVFMIKSLL